MNQTQDPILLFKAYHEAGHAVAAYALRIRFTLVTIDANLVASLHDVPDAGGSIETLWAFSRWVDPKKARQDALRTLTLLFAGEAGQWCMPDAIQRQVKSLPEGARAFLLAPNHDHEEAVKIARQVYGEAETSWGPHFMAHRNRAYDIIQAEGWREALDAVALALLEKLTLRYATVCRLVRTALTEAEVGRQMPSPMFS